MEKTRYAHYNINYHLVWIPKYRRKVLVGTIKADLETAIHEIAEKLEVKIESLDESKTSAEDYAPLLWVGAARAGPSARGTREPGRLRWGLTRLNADFSAMESQRLRKITLNKESPAIHKLVYNSCIVHKSIYDS